MLPPNSSRQQPRRVREVPRQVANPASLTYTVPQLRTVLNIGKTKAYELIGSGHLKAVKIGSRTLVSAESVKAYLASLPAFGREAGR